MSGLGEPSGAPQREVELAGLRAAADVGLDLHLLTSFHSICVRGSGLRASAEEREADESCLVVWVLRAGLRAAADVGLDLHLLTSFAV